MASTEETEDAIMASTEEEAEAAGNQGEEQQQHEAIIEHHPVISNGEEAPISFGDQALDSGVLPNFHPSKDQRTPQTHQKRSNRVSKPHHPS